MNYELAPEGEAGGSGDVALPGTSASTDAPASPPEATPQAPAEPEQSPAPATEDAGTEPASDEAPEPADADGEAPPEDGLTEDDWAEIYRLHPDRDPKNIEAKLKADLEEAAKTPEKARDADPLYRQVVDDARTIQTYIANVQQQLQDGTFIEDPMQLAAAVDVQGDFEATSERRGQIMLNRAIFERETGIDAGKVQRVVLGDADPDTLSDFERAYAEAITQLEAEQLASYRTLGSASAVFDGNKRTEIKTRAMLRDAAATGAFSHALMKLMREDGIAEGRREAEKQFGRRVDKVADQARKNGQTEAIAKARQVVTAGRANGITANGASHPARSEKEILADPSTPVSELMEIRSRQRRGG